MISRLAKMCSLPPVHRRAPEPDPAPLAHYQSEAFDV